MLECTNADKLVEDEARGRQKFVLLVLVTQWHLECLKQLEKFGREKFPLDQEKILFDKIKAEANKLKSVLTQFNIKNLKFVGIGLNDYKLGGDVHFNMFLVESLFSSYISISEEIPKIESKNTNPKDPLNTLKKSIKDFEYDKIKLSLDPNTKLEIDRYLNTRRDGDSLYEIYSSIDSLKKSFEENISIENNALALQRAFHIAGEYLKYTKITPNLSPDVRQSLEELGIPAKRLMMFRDMLAHNQIFPLIERDNNNIIKPLFDDFLVLQKVIKNKIIEIEDSFIQRIIDESKIGEAVEKELKQFKGKNGVQGLEKGIEEIRNHHKYTKMRKRINKEMRQSVDKVCQNVRRMKSMYFSESWEKISKLEVSKTYLDSFTKHISQSKLNLYDKIRKEIEPNLGIYVDKLNKAHADILTVTELIDRLNYKDTSSPNNSIFDKFKKVQVNDLYLKKQLEEYFDAESFKNNDVCYAEFKGINSKKLIDLLTHKISGPNDNKHKLITFLQSNQQNNQLHDNFIPSEEYERLVNGLPTSYNIKEKLFSYSVEWRKKKCVDLLEKNFSALKEIYDNIMDGKLIDVSVYTELAKQQKLSYKHDILKEKATGLNQSIEDVYKKRIIKEFDMLKTLKNRYAVESQIINMYSLLEKAYKNMIYDIRRFRNFLSHGDPLLSHEDYQTIADELVQLKDAVVGRLNRGPITPENIQGVLDEIESHEGLKSIRRLICIFDRFGRNIRSASESCLRWEEIDKFKEERAEYRDPDNIIIDSEKFISSISSELEANEEKFFNFIALASESEVIGDHTSKVNMLTDNHRYVGHLERVGKISGMVMHGMVAKNLVGDLLRGDYEDLAINVGFLIGSPLLSEVAKIASMKGAGYILEGRVLFGKFLQFTSPFLSRAVSAYIAYDLYRRLKTYKGGDIDALVPIIGDGVQVTLDLFEIGVEIGEGLSLLEGLSATTGPIVMTVGAVVFVGTDLFRTARTVYKIDKSIHLTVGQEVVEGIRAFFGLEPSDDIEVLMEEKDLNNQIVKNATSFLKKNTHIRRYVLPSIEVYTKDEPNPNYTKFIDAYSEPYYVVLPPQYITRKFVRKIMDNVVLLNEKKNDIKWSRTRPDNLEGINLFCLPKGDWESVPEGGTYYCDGAIGVEYTNNRTTNDTWISLGDGEDVIKGFQGSSNICVFGDGHKKMIGGNNNDSFIFEGKSVNAINDSKIEGSIDGRGGIDTIDVGGLAPHYEKSKGVGRYQVSADFRKGILKDTSKVALHIHNINVFLGRKGGVDRVVSACDTKHVDGRGGENKNYLDSITIPKDDACYYDTEVIVNPYTEVTNNATSGNFLYTVNGEKGKEAYVQFGPSSQSNNTFIFNYTLTDVAAIDESEKSITFSFVEEFYKREKKIDVNSSFNLTVSDADKSITTYYLTDNTKIVMNQNKVCATQNTEKPIDSLIEDYSSIADKSQIYVVVYSNNEVLAVGHNHGDVLMNDPTARTTHLVGGSGENVYVFTSGHEKLTLAELPISDVVIYHFDQGNKINTLDLRKITEQLKTDIDREINTDVSKINNDLLIHLSLDDASKKEVIKITLKGALKNNRYKRVHIDIGNILVIEQILDSFELTPQPLIFADNSRTIYVISPIDVAKGSKIIVKKEIGDYILARDNDALIITNSLRSSADKNNLLTIMLNDFYHENNQDKMKSLIIEFNDKRILLREKMAPKNVFIGNFSELKRKVKIDSYKAVMHAIKEEKLFDAIEGNNLAEVKELILHGVSIDARNNNGQTPLHIAAHHGELGIVKYLVEEEHADVNVKDNSGITSLHYAASGSLNVVKYLVEKKHADINVKDNSEIKPLHYAAFVGNLEIVKYLVEKKHADVNVKDNSGITSLLYAAFGGNLEVVKYLVEERHVDVNVKDNYEIKPLHYAALSGNLEVVKYLVEEQHADVNVKDNSGITSLHYAASGGSLNVVKYLVGKKHADINVKDNSGMKPLHYAAFGGNLEVVKYLVEEEHADINVNDNSGIKPLHLAARDGRLKVVKYLVEEKHANVNVNDNSGIKPLHYAASDSSPKVVKCIIEKKGATVNVRGISCQTVLHDAAFYGNREVVKYLIEEKGVRVDVRDYSQKGPLHLAASNGNLALVRYLTVEQGADILVRDHSGKVPLHLAASDDRLEVVKYLVEKKHADVNVKDYSGFTPLHLAVMNENLKVVKYLAGKGADVNLKDNSGGTPLHNAAAKGNVEMVKYLIEKGAKIDVKINGKTALNMLEAKSNHYKGVVDSIDKQLIRRLFDAVEYDDLDDVQRLISQGVSVNVKIRSANTLLHHAARYGNLRVVKYILKGKQYDFDAKENDLGLTILHTAAQYGKLGVVKYLVEEKHADVNVKGNSGITPLHLAALANYGDTLEVIKYLVEEKHADVYAKDFRELIPLDYATSNGPFPKVSEYLENKTRHQRHKRHNDHSRHEDGMCMHPVKHRQRRVQKRNVKCQDSHYYIDQAEKAASSGTRPSSWINGLLDWIKEKGGGLVSSVADKFVAKESKHSKPRGNHACSIRLEKMYSATISNIPQSRKLQGVPKGNIPNTSRSDWSSSREKVTSNVTDAPEMNINVLNNALILGDLAVRLVNGTRYKQPIHENLLSLREKSMRFIDENMIMRAIQQGREKFGGLDTNMDV